MTRCDLCGAFKRDQSDCLCLPYECAIDGADRTTTVHAYDHEAAAQQFAEDHYWNNDAADVLPDDFRLRVVVTSPEIETKSFIVTGESTATFYVDEADE